MKNLKNKIFEELKDYDKGIKQMLDFFAQSTSGVQSSLYTQKSNDADSIEISSIYDVLNNDEINLIKKQSIRPKECYRNAFVTCEVLEYNHTVKYVEGYLNMKGLPIEHAFVKVDDKYIDPTIELALNKNVNSDTYVKIGEFTTNEVRKIIVENGFWGQIYDFTFLNKYKENIKEAV